MPALRIDRVRTMNEDHVDSTLFHPFENALALVLDCTASSDLLTMPEPVFDADFQIINAGTDTVIVNHTWSHDLEWGELFWISMGNNWGPNVSDLTTPEKWGIHPVQWDWNDVFGFRGVIRANSWQGEHGLKSVDAIDVSEVRWFRVGKTSRL